MRKFLMSLLTLSVLFGCGTGDATKINENDNENQQEETIDTKDDVESANENNEEVVTFDDWTAKGVLNYFRENGAIEHEDYVLIQEGEDVTSFGVTQIASYYSNTDDTITIDIYYFDKNSGDKKILNALDEAKNEKTYTFSDGNKYKFDHFVDGMAFQFSLCSNDEVKQKFEDVYQKLISEYNLSAEY